jgi:hypothetical protein
MNRNLFNKLLKYILVASMTICSVLSISFASFSKNTLTSQASFKCADGYSYFAGTPENKSKPLPHNCTKVDDMVQVCENDYVPDPVRICRRDLVVYRCPKPLNPNDFIIHKSIVNPQFSKSEFTSKNLFTSLLIPLKTEAFLGDLVNTIPGNLTNYGDLCTDLKYKDFFSVGNICNTKVFGENPTSKVKPMNLTGNGIPLPDENGLVSYFNETALKSDIKNYPKFKADLYDVLNNDASPYANQLCQAPTKALRANITTSTRGNGCFLGIDCQTYIDIKEIIADIADTCNLQTRTCVSKVRCTRSIHKCEPQPENTIFPITDFNYYIGVEKKDDRGVEQSNGRAVQFQPDYENLPQERTYLPNSGSVGICPNSSEWRPFYVAPKTDFHIYDTNLMENKSVITPFTCVKKGFDLKAAYTILRDAESDCGQRTIIYSDNASVDDSAMLICTPPLTSSIKVPACPGGTSIKPLGDYTNIEGNKCFKSIEPEIYIVDPEVIGEPNCTPKSIKPNSKLNCVFNLSKSFFAGYENNLDFAKIGSNFILPKDSKYESCKPISPLPVLTNEEIIAKGLTKEQYDEQIKQKETEIYYGKITCASLVSTFNSKKYPGYFTLPDGGVKVKIQNIDSTNLATSDNCKIPSTIIKDEVTKKESTQYENLLVCENLKIGNSFKEEIKDIAVQINTSSFVKGKLEAKLGGCADGVADIYDCYSCLSGQAYAPDNPCSQTGESGVTKDTPTTGQKGNTFPSIAVIYETLPPNTPATIKPEGCSQTISGTIQAGGFVPNVGQVIPECAKTGPSTAILESNGSKAEIPTNFSDNNSPTIGAANPIKNVTKVGEPAPIIDLPNNTLPNGTPATFTPSGATTSIKGIIKDNQFIPDPGQKIPVGSTPGLAVGVLKTVDSSTGVLVNIQSNPELIKNIPFVRTGGAARIQN